MMGDHLLSLRIPRRPQRKWVEKPLCRWSPLPPLAGREASSIDSSSSSERAQNPPQSEATLAPASNHLQNTHNSYPVDPNLCYPVNKFNSTRFLLENASATETPSSGWLLPLGGKRRQIADSVHWCSRGFVSPSDLGDRTWLGFEEQDEEEKDIMEGDKLLAVQRPFEFSWEWFIMVTGSGRPPAGWHKITKSRQNQAKLGEAGWHNVALGDT